MTNPTITNELTKKIKSSKIYGFFHNDLDGYGCGKVGDCFVNLAGASYLTYGKVDSAIDEYCNKTYKEYDGLIVADLNLSMEKLEKLNKLVEEGHIVMYFDHHFKSLDQFDFFKKSNIIFKYDKDYCATYIMFKYFMSNGYTTDVNTEKFGEVITLIDSWDMYKWKDPNTFEVVNENAYSLSLYFKNFGFVKTIMKIDNYINDRFNNLFSNTEISIIDFLKRDIKRGVYDRNKNLVVMPYTFEDETMDIGVTFADKDVTEIGTMLNVLNKNLSFIVVVDMTHKSVNFRTIFNKPNLAKIAAVYGGGGHPKAAGCVLTNEAFNDFVSRTSNRGESFISLEKTEE